jgi:aminoglycoside phosphotransferase (APT) family kinase protein
VTPEAVADYLGERTGEAVAVRSVRRAFPGMSRETWLVHAAGPSGDLHLVLRVDSVGAETPFPLRREWDVYLRLWPTAVPVPEPLWYDPGAALVDGRPLFARRLVDGSPRPFADMRGNEADGQRAALRLAEALATLHTLDWRGAGFGGVIEVPDPDDPYRAEIETWTGIWESGKTDPFPLVTEVLAWLHECRPRSVPVALLKGNNGIGEEIWRDGEIVALVDWELAALGDPALDLAFSQGLLALAPGDVLACYAARTGDEVGPERLAFAGLWVTFKSLCCLNACGLRSHLDGKGPRSHRVNLGMGVAKNFERILGGVVGLDPVDAYDRLAPELPGNGYMAGVSRR